MIHPCLLPNTKTNEPASFFLFCEWYKMTSTRNKNTRENYRIEQRNLAHAEEYSLYPHASGGSIPGETRLPGNGFGPAQIPWMKLSYNAPAIESFLFGIGSVNLTEPPPPPFVPELISPPPLNLFENAPIFMPRPLVIQENRPFSF